MSRCAALVRNRHGAAAAEMALVAPLLALIGLGSAELGRFFYNQHIIVKAVRDGAIFAARQPITKFNCATHAVDTSVRNSTFALIKTGALASGTDLLPHSSEVTANYDMRVDCVTAAGGTTLGGIYSGNGGQVPVITVNATVPYNTIMKGFGFNATINLRATEQATVTAI